MMARFDARRADWWTQKQRWAVPAGRYDVKVNSSADSPVLNAAT